MFRKIKLVAGVVGVAYAVYSTCSGHAALKKAEEEKRYDLTDRQWKLAKVLNVGIGLVQMALSCVDVVCAVNENKK